MKACIQVRLKSFFSSKSGSDAAVQVIGSLILLMILFILVGLAASSFFESSRGGANFRSPVAKIDLEFYEGGLPWAPDGEQAKFDENFLVLEHGGGDSLPLKSTSIRISGYGMSFHGIPGHEGNSRVEGDIIVYYSDLSSEGKNPDFYLENNEKTIDDGFWDVGEKLILCGKDSAEGDSYSSVKVSVGGGKNTSDNYGFKAGSEITLKVIDTEGRNVIADRTAVVECVKD